MTYRLTYILWLGVVLFATTCGSSTDSKVVLKMGHMANEQNIWHKSAEVFAKVADSLSNGQIEVQIFPSEQLGAELDLLRSINLGAADMAITGESMQNWAEITSFCGTPYLIKDFDHLDRVLASEVGEQMASEMIEKIGLRPLAYLTRGPRHLTTNRPIKSPDDLNGLIMRVPPVPLSVAVWEALGAKPTPMAFSEVFTSLQSGTVEAQENPFSLIQSAGFHEVQDYVNLTGHVIGWIYVVIGEKRFNKLSAEHQGIVTKAGQAMHEYHQREFFKQEEAIKKDLMAKGMEMVEVDGAAFQKIASEVVVAKLPEHLVPAYNKIQEFAQ
jgi:tripartite ATP-independent transporter DctP family solute receptor